MMSFDEVEGTQPVAGEEGGQEAAETPATDTPESGEEAGAEEATPADGAAA